MAPSPRKRLLSPRKRLPPTPFDQTWHETDTAHLDPSALPVARIPRAWERKRQVKQTGDGKEKSIWRRFDLRSSIANAPAEKDEDENDEGHDARLRAVKRRQRMSPKAMEKMQGNKRAFKGTRWDRRKSVLPRKKAAHNNETLLEEGGDSDDAQDTTDADMANQSFTEAAEVPEAQEGPSSFTFSAETHTADDLPDYESLDEQDNDDQKLGNILPEDSTFALIFKSPTKGTSTPVSASPAKVEYPTLPSSTETEQLETSLKQQESAEPLVAEPTTETVIKDIPTNAQTHTLNFPDNNLEIRDGDDGAIATTAIAEDELETADPSTREDADIHSEEADEVAYPTLPNIVPSDDQSIPRPSEDNQGENEDEDNDADMSEIQLGTYSGFVRPSEIDGRGLDTTSDMLQDESADEQFTEASMQLDIQEDYEKEGEFASLPPTQESPDSEAHDITDGLTITLTPVKAPSDEHVPKRLHSPPPPLRIETGPDDATMTIAVDDDTAILKSFLSRAAASKAERAAVITRRESLENRRDSDIVRHALASPRKALEEKDPNSPTKIDSEITFDLSETPVLSPETEEASLPTLEQPGTDEATEAKTGRGSRRSSRANKSRLPAPATVTQPQTSKIAIRRADGTDPVVLKKTDAQELALITRNNTRKNKQGAFMVNLRLLKLQADAILSPSVDLVTETPREPIPGKKSLRWDETLAYYQEHADTIAAQIAEAESLATPDELSLSEPSSGIPSTKKPKVKTSTDKNSTPKVRRVRGLGTANGTPGKGLLATGSLLPEATQEEQAAAPPQPAPKSIPKPKISKKLPVASTSASWKLATLEVTPVGVEPTKERKSRLAPPKSVKLPKSTTTGAAAEKENARTGISATTPRKGIPAPKIVAPKTIVPPTASVGVDSGLPRRRGRK